MIQINKLYSLETIRDCYYVMDTYQIINIDTGKILKQTEGNQGYKYVNLYDIYGNCQKPTVHKIIALAFINNGPYTVINHIDGNKHNNLPSNLEFCTQQHNALEAIRLGLTHVDKYRVTINEGIFYRFVEGTLTELSDLLCIPRDTLSTMYKRYNGQIHVSHKYPILKIEKIH